MASVRASTCGVGRGQRGLGVMDPNPAWMDTHLDPVAAAPALLQVSPPQVSPCHVSPPQGTQWPPSSPGGPVPGCPPRSPRPVPRCPPWAPRPAGSTPATGGAGAPGCCARARPCPAAPPRSGGRFSQVGAHLGAPGAGTGLAQFLPCPYQPDEVVELGQEPLGAVPCPLQVPQRAPQGPVQQLGRQGAHADKVALPPPLLLRCSHVCARGHLRACGHLCACGHLRASGHLRARGHLRACCRRCGTRGEGSVAGPSHTRHWSPV